MNVFKITTIITTSPIPSIPSIKIIKSTIDSLKLIPYLDNQPFIIAFDGFSIEKNKDKLDSKCL